MKVTLVGVLMLATALATPVLGQTTTSTTNTNCNVYGNNANCTSTTTTTDQSAQQKQNAEASYRAGQALGDGIAAAMQRHSFSKGLRKYCDAHPGQEWHYFSRADGHVISSGYCPSNADKTSAAMNDFLAHHKEVAPGEPNSSVIASYITDHNLDPREKKSYDAAYKDLKTSGRLSIYNK